MGLIFQVIFLLLDISFFKGIKSKSNTNIIKTKLRFNNAVIRRNLTTINDNQKLTNIINIYNPYNIVSYISSQNNENGDLFITTNSKKAEDKRLVYALKSDGTNYFSNNKESYLIYNISIDLTINGYNKYTMITPLIMNNNEGLLTLSHEGSFEAFDFNSNFWFYRFKTDVMTDNSLVTKNTFIYLKYYNNSNYAINSYIGKGKNRLFIQKLYFKNVNLTKYRPKE